MDKICGLKSAKDRIDKMRQVIDDLKFARERDPPPVADDKLDAKRIHLQQSMIRFHQQLVSASNYLKTMNLEYQMSPKNSGAGILTIFYYLFYFFIFFQETIFLISF